MSSSLSYAGDQDPSVLSEEVVVATSIPVIVSTSIMGGFGLAMTLALLLGVAEMALADWTFGSPIGVGILGLSALFSTGLLIRLWRSYVGMKAIISEVGIEVRKGSVVIASSPWSQMTLRVEGKGWRRVCTLCDARGVALWHRYYDSSHPDRFLAMSVMATRKKQLLAEVDVNGKVEPEFSFGWLAAGIMIGFGCIPLFLRASNHLLEILSDPSSPPSVRLGWLAAVIATGVGASVGLLSLQMTLDPITRWMKAREIRKVSPLRSYIDVRKGRLDAVEMEVGRTYIYIDPRNLKGSNLLNGLGYALFLYGLIFGGILIALWGKRDQGTLNIVVGLASLSVIGAIPCFRIAGQFFNVLHASFRKCPDGTIEIVRGTKTQKCTVMKTPRSLRASSVSFGALTVVVRSSDGETFRIDPRFLVPTDVSDS